MKRRYSRQHRRDPEGYLGALLVSTCTEGKSVRCGWPLTLMTTHPPKSLLLSLVLDISHFHRLAYLLLNLLPIFTVTMTMPIMKRWATSACPTTGRRYSLRSQVGSPPPIAPPRSANNRTLTSSKKLRRKTVTVPKKVVEGKKTGRAKSLGRAMKKEILGGASGDTEGGLERTLRIDHHKSRSVEKRDSAQAEEESDQDAEVPKGTGRREKRRWRMRML